MEPKYKEIADHKEAKTVMKDFLETVIDQIEEDARVGRKSKTQYFYGL